MHRSIHWLWSAALVTMSGLALAACKDNDARGDAGGDAGVGGCTAEGVDVEGEIDTDTTWSCGLYVLHGHVFVVNDATLTIDPGVEIVGATGGAQAAALVVTRGARIDAEGTAQDPIVFTSGGPDGARITGDWGGVVLLGSATTNDGECVGASDAACTGGYLQDRIEGIDPADVRGLYGGTDDASSCGTLRYVRVEFAGREISPDNELNGLTLGACGAGTSLSYIQVHRGKDDGIELFGGTASMDHVVITGASDDSLDFDEGWRGNAQFVVLHEFPGVGDRAIEADNFGSNEIAVPTTRPNLWNFTVVGTDDTKVALLREGMRGILGNFIVTTFGGALDVNASTSDPGPAWPADFFITHNVFHDVGAFPPEDLSLADFWTEADTMVGGALPDTTPANLGALLHALDEAKADGTITAQQASTITAFLNTDLDDDLGFDEEARLSAADNVFDVDPELGDASASAPNYLPANASLPAGAAPVFNAMAPAAFGDTAATFVGAFGPGAADWTAGWTAYPTN